MARAATPFMRRMEQSKRHAMHNRNKGRHVGASAKGWDVSRKLDRDSYHDAARVALTSFQQISADALNDYRLHATYGSNFVDETTIPF